MHAAKAIQAALDEQRRRDNMRTLIPLRTTFQIPADYHFDSGLYPWLPYDPLTLKSRVIGNYRRRRFYR